MADQLILYGSPHSQFTYKIALMLRLAGQPFAFRYVSFQKGVHLTPEFRALSRWGQVPVLRCGDRVLVQSGAILEHLAETLSAFGAQDEDGRQVIREWLYWDADRLAPAVYGCYGVRLGEMKLLPIDIHPVIAADYRRSAETAFGALELQLVGKKYLLDPEPTIADIACYGDVAFAELSGIELTGWQNIAGWAARIAGLPGFRRPLDLLPMADADIGA